MSNVPDWLLVVTGLGGGVAGAVVTTYGTQTKERRQTRAQARNAIRIAENLAYRTPAHLEITAALARLETSAMLAGLSRGLTELHREARMRHWVLTGPAHADDPERLTKKETVTSGRVAHQSAELLVRATWHPWVTAPYRWYRTRRLVRLLDAGMPARARFDRDRRSNLRRWERETIRQGKNARVSSVPGGS